MGIVGLAQLQSVPHSIFASSYFKYNNPSLTHTEYNRRLEEPMLTKKKKKKRGKHSTCNNSNNNNNITHISKHLAWLLPKHAMPCPPKEMISHPAF